MSVASKVSFLRRRQMHLSDCSCYNALDRWVEAGRGNQACFLWEGNGAPVFRARTMSYREVLDETCRLVRSTVLI